MTHPAAVDLSEKLARVSEHWAPRIVADFNGHDVMVAKGAGAFPWHSHPDTDDLFLLLSGTMRIELREGGAVRSVPLAPGQLFVVPQGVEHRPVAEGEAHFLLIEPAGTPNTGDPATAAVKERI